MSDFVLLEGFDYYNSAGTGAGGVVSTQWNPSGDGEYDIIAGLIGGGQCLRMGDITGGSQRVLTRTLPAATATFSVGAFTRSATDAAQFFLRLRNASGAVQVQLNTSAFTDMVIIVAGVTLTTIPNVWPTTTAVKHIEVVGTIHPSAGTINFYVDKVLVYSFTGDTSAHATDHTINTIDISCGNGTGSSNWFYFDHLYVNTTAVQHGDLLIDYVPVAADTADKDWVPSTGTANAALLDEVPVAVADYVTGSVVGDLDVYDLGDLVADTTDILAVQPVILAAKTDAGARECEVQLRNGSGQVDALVVPGITTQFFYGVISDTDPNTAAPWTYGGFNNAKLGLEVTA